MPFLSWLLTFPLFGPVFMQLATERGANPEPASHVFLWATALALVGAPVLLHRRPTVGKGIWCSAGILLGTGGAFLFPAGSWPLWFGIMGLSAGAWITAWVIGFSAVTGNWRGRTLAIPTAAANLVLYGIIWAEAARVPLVISGAMVVVFAAGCLGASAYLPRRLDWSSPEGPGAQWLWSGRHRLFGVFGAIFALYLVGGVMFQELYGELAADRVTGLVVGVLPYVAAALFAGWWVDGRLLAHATAAGIACLGMGLLAWGLVPAPWAPVVTQTLSRMGWGLIDISLWVFLTRLPGRMHRLVACTGGLAVMVVAISAGAWIGDRMSGGGLPGRILVGSAMLFAAVPMLPFLAETVLVGRREGWPRASLPSAAVLTALAAYELTRREEEVAAYLLAGLNQAELCQRLFISRSTLKTHLRHIYRKCGVRDRETLYELVRTHREGHPSRRPS